MSVVAVVVSIVVVVVIVFVVIDSVVVEIVVVIVVGCRCYSAVVALVVVSDHIIFIFLICSSQLKMSKIRILAAL